MKKIFFIITGILMFIVNINAQTIYTVTKTGDYDPFIYQYNYVDSLCDTTMYGTLQWAVRKVNDTFGPCEIRFAIAGAGQHIIPLNYYLPSINNTVTIDGTTQPGYQIGNPQVILDGQEKVFQGLFFNFSSNCTVEGLYIRNQTTYGINASNAENLTVRNCVINSITADTNYAWTVGILLSQSSNCTIQGNYIGTDYQNSDLPIKHSGILVLLYSNNNLIGGTENGQGNVVANCVWGIDIVVESQNNSIIGNIIYNNVIDGIRISLNSNQNRISRNSIYNNPTGIEISNSNNNKAAPVITSATTNTVSGTSAPNDIIEIFGSSGNENMNEYLTSVNADASGSWSANVTTTYPYIVATATDIESNTSLVSSIKSITIQACKDEVLHYHISGANTSSPVNITITYPNGVNGLNNASIQGYPATNIQIDTTNPSIPQYTFNAPDTSFTFNYHIIASCENFSPTTQNIHYSINQDGIITTDSFNLSSPWIVFDPIKSQNIIYNNAHLGTAFERTFYYKNTSLSGVFSGVIEFRDTIQIPSLQTAIHIDSVWVVAPASGTIDVLYSEITDSTVIYKVKVENIGFLDSIEFKELVFLNDCPNGYNNLTFFNAKYGCDSSNLCVPINSTYPYTQTFFDPNDKPIISYTILTPGYQSCWSDSLERVMMVVNNGGGSAESVYIGITSGDTPFGGYQNNITDHPINDFEVFRKVNGIEIPIPFVTTPVIFWYNDNAIKTIDSLNPHDTIYFRYYEKINCIDSSNYNNYFNEITYMHWEGFPSVQLNHPCYPSTMPYPFIPSGNGYYNASWCKSFKLNQTFNNLIGTMPNGDTAWFDVSSNSLDLGHNDSWNCYGFIFDMDNSELIVELDLEPGLGLVDSNLYLSSIHNNITTNLYANSIEFTPDPNGFADGNKIKAKFSFPDSMYYEYTDHYSGIVDLPKPSFNNFFNDFKVNFQLYADCHFAADTPTTITQKVFFNPNKTCANQCLIPLSKVEDNIFILCPGCLLPGWNISEFEIKRTNFGGADTNNNNYPDSYPVQAVDTNIAQNQHIIVGDTINCHIIAHTSDGESLLFNNIGFPFTNGQLLCKGGILNNLKFIGGNGTFNDAGNGTFNFAIPSLANTIVLDSAFALDIGISALENYGVPNSVDSFNLGDLFDFNLRFVVTDNLIFPGGLNPLYNIKEMDAFVNMSGTPYTGIDVKSDASNYQQDTLLAMTPGDRAILNYWCTGYEGRVVAIGTDFHSEMESMNYGVGHDGDINNFNPCYNTIGLTSTTDLGRTLSTYNWEWQTPSTPMEWNTFSFELRNLWMLDSLTFSFPDAYKIDRIDIKATQLTDIDTSSNNVVTGFNCTMFNTHRTLINVNDLYSYDISSSTDAIITDSTVTIYPYNHYSQITGFQGCDNVLTAYDETKRYRVEVRLKMKDYQLTPNTIAGSEYVRAFWSSFPGASSGDTTIINNYNMTFTKPVANLQTQTLLHEQDYLNTDLVWNMIINTDTNLTTGPGLIYNRAENSFIYFLSPHNNIFVDSVLWTNNQTHVPVVNTINSNPLYGLGRIGADWTTIDSAHISIYARYDCSNVGTTDTLIAIYGWNCYGYPDTLENACYLDTTYLIINLLQTGYQVDLSTNNTISVCDTATYDITVTATGTGSVENIQIDMAESLNNEYSYVPGSAYIQYNGSTEFLEPSNIHLDSLTWLLDSVSILNNFETDTLHLIFNVAGGCGFGNHDVGFTVTAENYCTKPLGTIHVSGIPLITGFLIQDSLLVNIIADTISVCGSDSALVQVTITNTGSNPTSALNTLDVIIPSSFSWSSGDTYTSSIGQTYTFNLNSGIMPLSSQTIQFYISGNSGNGIFDVIANAYVAQSLPCNNDTCVFAQTVAESTDTSTITVHEITIASITPDTTTICSGAIATLTAFGGGTYLWNTTDTTQTINVTPVITTTYTVTVTNTAGCTATATSTVNVSDLPTASISILNTDTNCIKVGNSVLFSAPSQSGATFTWDFGDGTTDTIQNPSHLFTDFGFYQVNLTITNSCDTASDCRSIYINPATYNCYTVYTISNDTILSGNVAWTSGTIIVKGDVYIPNGQSLNIANTTVQFAPRSRLIVGKGGRLVIKNAILDGLDNNMWQGIEVWGQPNLASTDTLNQGRVYITNNSSIKDAYIGVLLGKRAYYGECHSFIVPVGGWDTQKSGGVIRAKKSTFTGNGVDIRFTEKTNNDGQANMIDSCNFNCPAIGLKDAHYNINNLLHYPNIRNPWAGYANANKRTDIGIVSVGLSKLKITNSNLNNLEYGIYTFDNKQTVVSNCKFSYHRQGIRVYNTVTTMQSSYDISGCNFDSIPGNTLSLISYNDDGTAIYTSGSYGDSIHDGNLFRNNYIPFINPAYGIKTNNASGFEITNNVFRDLTNGITIQNSFTSGGNVRANASSNPAWSWFGNQFNSCKTGITTWNDNSALCLRCNEHNNSNNYIINWKNGPGSILANQGFTGWTPNLNTPVNSRYGAGNKFDLPSQNKLSSNSTYNYYYHSTTGYEPDTIGSPLILKMPTGIPIFTKIESCPFPPPFNMSIINLPISLNSSVFLRIDSLNNVVSGLESQYLTLLNNADKGHTNELLNAINAVPPSGQLKNMLIANSPLSDTVLVALNIHNPLSNGNYKNVMDENLPVTRNVVPSFISRVETLPTGIKNQLKAKQASNPNKITLGYLETMLNQAKLTKQLYFNEIISLLLENNRKADAITLFEREGTPAANMLLAATYISDSNYSSAITKIALLPDDNSQYSQWKAYSTFLLNFYAQGKTLEQLDNSQIEYVRTVAYQCPEGMATVNAKAILMYLYREEVPPCPINGTRSIRFENKEIKQINTYLGDNYPDPFSRNTIIPYYLPEGDKGEIEVKDVTGRIILTLSLHEGENKLEIDSKEWANGIYFYGMSINNENIENKKMIKTE